jgi:TonB family protein
MKHGLLFRLGLLALTACWDESAAQVAQTAVDSPCRIDRRVNILFPVRALSEGIPRGEVVLMLDVDRQGQLQDIMPIAFTRHEFADAAMASIREWRFIPGVRGGEPVGAIITLKVEFELTGVLAYVKPITMDEKDGVENRFEYRPLTLGELDAVPRSLVRDGPIYPKTWIEEGRVGMVTVEFLIDESGRVRFAHLLPGGDDLLGAAAVAAVREWRFAPPLRRGRPVLARGQQVFHFHPESKTGPS